jgi:radical SAM protein with 4Fe4S-binding SPASM domain
MSARLNFLKCGLNIYSRRLVPWSWPIYMQVELTNYCNLRCPVCPTGLRTLGRQPRAMDPAFFDQLMEEVGRYLLVVSLWGWGEPLLHPKLEEILSTAGRYGFASIVSTNGQNLNDPRVLRVLSDHPPTYLIVALDGLTDETNSVFRVGARLQPALEGVRRLAQLKREKGLTRPVLHLRFIAMKHNEHELPQLKDFAAENDFEFLTVRTLSIIDAPEGEHFSLRPESPGFRAYGYKGDKRVKRSDFVCQHAFMFPAVFADGTVTACDQDFGAGHRYGRIDGSVSFRDIWFGEESVKVRKAIRDDPGCFSFCRNCPYADRPINTCSIQAFDLRKRENHLSVSAIP